MGENHRWFRKLIAREPHFIIGDGPEPYLRRWYLIPRNHFFNVYLHHFLRSDDDRALHDHPWPFLSWILKGRYWEWTPDPRPEVVTTFTERNRWSVAYRPAKWLHRIELDYDIAPNCYRRVEKPVWTLIITGPKTREWGFDCPNGWKHWTQFEHDNGCGEHS